MSRRKRLIAAVRKLEEAKCQARVLDKFIDDRELLECPSCGLWEDVTVEGLLITYPSKSPFQVDSGLRFKEIHEARFECPVCSAIVRANDDGEMVVREQQAR